MGPIEQSMLDNLKNLKDSLEVLEGNVNNIKAQLETAIDNVDDVYNEGFEAGKKEAPVPPSDSGEKLYSQAELDAAVVSLNEKISSLVEDNERLGNIVDSLNSDLDVLKKDMEAKVKSEVKVVKASLLEKFKAQQAGESAGESEFEKSLSDEESV